jgi:hypothetical protein
MGQHTNFCQKNNLSSNVALINKEKITCYFNYNSKYHPPKSYKKLKLQIFEPKRDHEPKLKLNQIPIAATKFKENFHATF